MPLYEYVCKNCNSEFELLIRGSDTPQCPECGGKKLQRQMSAPSAHVEGPSCPGASERCAQQPMSCCGAKGCCHS